MAHSKFLASRLRNPTGITGRMTAMLWNRRNAALNETALQALALQAGDSVLEIGFGGGYLLDHMVRAVSAGLVAGVDSSPTMVSLVARRHAHAIAAGLLDLQCAPAEGLPYTAGHFNKVCSVNSIFYWQDADLGCAEIRRVLVEGGRVVLCLTCKSSLENKRFAGNIRLFEAGEVEQLLTEHGFRQLEARILSDRHRRYLCVTGIKGNDAGNSSPAGDGWREIRR